MKNSLSQHIEAIFLDFDGVVVESLNIKSQAFYEIYMVYGEEIANKAKKYHIEHQGVSRYIKFQEIHQIYLKRKLQIEQLEELSKQFSVIVLTKIIQCPFVDGVLKFLEQKNANNIPIFLLSATPHEELIDIVKARKLQQYFKDIYGAPSTKVDSGKKIIEQFKLNPQKIVFVGDSRSDFMASNDLGTNFILRQTENNKFLVAKWSIKNFFEML